METTKTEATTKVSLEEKKAELNAKREELNEFLKEKGLKKGQDYSQHTDDKIAKKFRILTKAIKLLQAERDELNMKSKGEKTPKVVTPREAKYPYPAGASGDDKKKFRQAYRAKAKYAGVDINTYLANPEKYAKIVAEKEAAKSAKKVENGKKLAAAAAAKKAAATEGNGEAKPVKKAEAKAEAKVVPLAKKKKTPAPTAEEED